MRRQSGGGKDKQQAQSWYLCRLSFFTEELRQHAKDPPWETERLWRYW